MYYMHYSEDDSTTKFTVAIVWVMDTLHVSFMCHMLYYYLIINYGAPMSLEYIASLFVNSFVITIVQLFFAHKIYHLSHYKLRWLVTTPIILLGLVHFGFSMATAVVMLVNDTVTHATQARYYTAFPTVFTILLAEVLNTVSLCVLLYEKGSHSAFPRTKRLLNTLIIYAVNRCLLTLPIVIAEAVLVADDIIAWTMALSFLTPKLYANSFLASLNTRQHLRSQGSSLECNLGVVHFANPLKLSGDAGSSVDEVKRFDKCEGTVIDITARGEARTLQREVEV
ncbi:hypothetical protein PISMIDRAFT_612442 [Pisolithus microcarpus 441]|uniref:DUF6534 domain-containing protein n=1 Tax=Pisolithus microcarpus 441 TaxID=765257 RepID=A0A0C9ZG63_9AGAM|nr:hypothetical protein PISMIDRAFT_612442 [Pisolithus microcarpus 441]